MMQFKIEKRDGPGRIGELILDDKSVITPNILYVSTSRFKPPDFADILLTNKKDKNFKKPVLRNFGSKFSKHNSKDQKKFEFEISNFLVYPKDLSETLHFFAINSNNKKKNCYVIPGKKEIIPEVLKDNSASFFIVAGAFQLFQQHSKFTDFMVELRGHLGSQKTIYLPTIGKPNNFALLAYMGADFFDSISAVLAARDNNLFFPTGSFNINEISELPCSCPACNKHHGEPSEMNFQQILNHNTFVISEEIKQVRNAINIGCLRELVETRVRTTPALTAILRDLDWKHYRFLEENTPITRKHQLLATTNEALYRPEIRRFQERLIERYRKPKSAKILLFLPCSAKKPYSFSKSHRLFKNKINALKNPNILHKVIITSPLGIVPGELELIYPASSYDIPVTGIWNEDEKKLIRQLLTKYLAVNKYDHIIMHLPDTIVEFIQDLTDNMVSTCIYDKPTSKQSLEKLHNCLKENTDNYKKIKNSIRERENMQSLASYQFGYKNSEKLIDNCQIKGRYPNQKIMYNHKQLGMITQERGLISLTLDGAERIKDSQEYWVHIYDDFQLKGSVLSPGIKEADEKIRIGDETIIFRNKKLYAVGIAQMNGKEMMQSTYGEAVKIRHRL